MLVNCFGIDADFVYINDDKDYVHTKHLIYWTDAIQEGRGE